MITSIVLYACIVVSLIWARLRFFKMTSGTPRLSALLYDAAVATQIITTLVLMFTVEGRFVALIVLSVFLYSISLLMFWWAIITAKSLDFAFSDEVGRVVTTGPFKIVRHPFYTSYMLAWFASSFLFNSLILWITLVFLVAFYFLSARKEERVILKSAYSDEYRNYIKNVGMFLPRIRNGKDQVQDSNSGKRN